MSAIAGILYFGNKSVQAGLIQELTDALKSRGPDEQTHWVQGQVALGHCMLRTTPESQEEHLPLISNDKDLVLVWDGRLDNREELKQALNLAGAITRDNSDAEIVLQSYSIWDEDCPKHMLGDFAFAIWDVKRNKLFCARDHMGARPFYYVMNEDFFAFASEDEVLIKLPGISATPNEELIAYYLFPRFSDFGPSRSWLRDIFILQPAHRMTLDSDKGFQSNSFWELKPKREIKYKSDEECSEAFLMVFKEAVRCRMRSIGDVSAMMSGGLDSASIGEMIKKLLPEMRNKKFHTYSAISDEPENCAESRRIRTLTEDFGAVAHFVSVPSFSGMVTAEDLIGAAETASHPVNNSILLQTMMCLAANRDNNRVMLHGGSGDLTTYVQHRYVAILLSKGRWKSAWRECCDASQNNVYLRGSSPVSLFLRNALLAYTPKNIRLFARWMRKRNPTPDLMKSIINLNLSKKLKIHERIMTPQRQEKDFELDPQEALIQIVNSQHGISSGLTGVERVAGKYGIETRDPWSDKRVVEFWLSLPLEYKIRNGWTKYLVRTAFAKDLDEKVIWHTGKEHLGWEFNWRYMESVRDRASCILKSGANILNKYTNCKMLQEQLDVYQTFNREEARRNVNKAIVLVQWMQRLA
jgi:asparagine synthase (glutamine-hydrolysing)